MSLLQTRMADINTKCNYMDDKGQISNPSDLHPSFQQHLAFTAFSQAVITAYYTEDEWRS